MQPDDEYDEWNAGNVCFVEALGIAVSRDRLKNITTKQLYVGQSIQGWCAKVFRAINGELFVLDFCPFLYTAFSCSEEKKCMFQDWDLSGFSRPGPRAVRFVGKRKHARLMSGHFTTIAGRWLQADSSPVQPVTTLFLSSSSRNRQGPWTGATRCCTTPPS